MYNTPKTLCSKSTDVSQNYKDTCIIVKMLLKHNLQPLIIGFLVALGFVAIAYLFKFIILFFKRRLEHFAVSVVVVDRERQTMLQHMETEILQSSPIQRLVNFFGTFRNLPKLQLAKRLAALTSDEPKTQRALTDEEVAECRTCIICHEDLEVGECVPNIPHACFNVNFVHSICLKHWWKETIKKHLEIRCPFCSIDIRNVKYVGESCNNEKEDNANDVDESSV